MIETNAIVIHGGGLCEPSKHVLMRIGHNLSSVYNKVFIGQFSFESLYTPDFIKEYNQHLINEVQDKRGTYFGTSRGIDLAHDYFRFKKAVSCLKDKNISTIIVAGGDGSSRQVNEVNSAFAKEGINNIFPLPLTIDGINGGLSIGVNEAVNESIRQVENIVSTSLQTRDYGKFGVVIVELQGRDRDDIMAKVLKHFDVSEKVADFYLNDLTLKVIPANLKTDSKKLIDEINSSNKRTLILLSEGASKKDSTLSIPELTKKINRKVRSLTVGHSSQSNNLMYPIHAELYDKWVDNVCRFIARNPYDSFCVANIDFDFLKMPIDYYAKLNPFNGLCAELPDTLNNLIKSYMTCE